MTNADADLRTCRVCGYRFDDWLPWGEDGDSPTYDFCPSCGVEFGYADASTVGIATWRQRWLDAGATWFDRKWPSDGLSTDARLAQVPARFR